LENIKLCRPGLAKAKFASNLTTALGETIMKTQKIVHRFVYLMVLAMCFSVSALAQSSSQSVERVAPVSSDSSQVRWQPTVEYDRIVLTVSTPGGAVLRKEFESGVPPSFKITDDQGLNLADGHYVYELRVIPNLSPETKKALAASREKGNTDEVMHELQRGGRLPSEITVQSGSFLIQNGVVLVGGPEDAAEPRTANPNAPELQSKKKGGGTFTIQDQVIADDLIVQGSACVGLDCVNNESFGFDTIRLKENNTRIKFQDTSTATGFPTHDWQLTANDSASGGAEKFSIEDITAATVPFTVTGSAPTSSVFVASDGKVGFRTSTPVLDLHIVTGNTPAHRLEQTSAGGFNPQTWDIGANEANFFVRDVTGGSRLPFRVRPGAPTSSIDISASGNVGIGTASPGTALHVFGDSASDKFAAFGPSASGSSGGDGLNIGYAGASFPAGQSFVNAHSATAGAGKFRVMVNADTKIIVQNDGNVGIGTTTPLGKLDVNGSIFQRGVQLFADYVFEPSYALESIEDHAAFMWNNRHLPAVGARKVDEQGREIVEIGARMRGLLEELEKAHIYISTLNSKVTERDEQLAKLERQNAELSERLARIEAMLSVSKSEKK
jgi:hypothetical protein